jgi:hypothetical protein
MMLVGVMFLLLFCCWLWCCHWCWALPQLHKQRGGDGPGGGESRKKNEKKLKEFNHPIVCSKYCVQKKGIGLIMQECH